MPGPVIETDKRMRGELAGDVARLYVAGKQHSEIGAALHLSKAQAHRILSELFAEGMPKLERRSMSDGQVRAIHAAYVRGWAPIDRCAEAMGFTGSAVRQRMRRLRLPVERQKVARNPARTPAQTEQRVITALLMAGRGTTPFARHRRSCAIRPGGRRVHTPGFSPGPAHRASRQPAARMPAERSRNTQSGRQVSRRRRDGATATAARVFLRDRPLTGVAVDQAETDGPRAAFGHGLSRLRGVKGVTQRQLEAGRSLGEGVVPDGVRAMRIADPGDRSGTGTRDG